MPVDERRSISGTSMVTFLPLLLLLPLPMPMLLLLLLLLSLLTFVHVKSGCEARCRRLVGLPSRLPPAPPLLPELGLLGRPKAEGDLREDRWRSLSLAVVLVRDDVAVSRS